MGRVPSCSKGEREKERQLNIKKGAWTADEDEKLVSFIEKNQGHGSWRTLPSLAGLERCGKSCRLRWTNYLRPNIKRGNFTSEEERIILQLHAVVGNKWSTIASHLPGRTDNEVKNHWNTHLKKRLTKMGIDPMTHLPLNFLLSHHQNYGNYVDASQSDYCNQSSWQKVLHHSLQLDSSIASHLVQWELARLEAEARQQLVTAHGAYMQNYYASWLQSLQQNQAPSFNLNDFIHAWNLQLQATSNPPSNLVEPHLRDTQSYDPSSLKNLYPLLCQGKDLSPPAINVDTNTDVHRKESKTLSQISLNNQVQNDHVYSSTISSIATPETCSTSDTLSSHLHPEKFVFDDFDLDLSSNSSYHNIIAKKDDLEKSPLIDDDITQHDSYWHRMLNLVGHATFDNL